MTDTSKFSTEQVFGSREELMTWVQNVARSQGFVIITKRSRPSLIGYISKIVLGCDRGGVPRSKDAETKKINCPFELVGKYLKAHAVWTLRVVCDYHNHKPTMYMEGHSHAMRLSDDESRLVQQLTRLNVKPRDILSTLKERNEDNVSSLKTIYNARHKFRISEQEDRTPIQNVMHILQTKGYDFEYRLNDITNQLEELFFIHPTSFKMWQSFPHVVLMDTTYKTNKYNLPFLEIVGVTSTNKTFSIAFAFMHNEKTSNYTWALTCLKLTINGSFCPRVIVTDRDLALMKAYEEVFPQSNHLHLDSGKCDLDKFIHVIEKVVKSQDTAIKESLERCTIIHKPKFNKSLFQQLQSFVSEYAMDKIVEELHRSNGIFLTPENCGCQLRTCFGLPCAHELAIYVGADMPIPLDSVDAFWKKLDLSPSISVEYGDLNCDHDMQRFKEIFINQPDHGKSSFLRKLRGITDLSKILIGEPSVKKNTRGRPKVKRVHNQTQVPHRYSCSDLNQELPRHSSFFMDLNEEPPRHSSSFMDLNEEPPRHSSSFMDLNEEPPRHNSSFMDLNEEPISQWSHQIDLNEILPEGHSLLLKQIPEIFHPYITNIQDVRGDGNCGFRSIAVCLGYGEDQWLYVRHQLLDELTSSYEAYSGVFYGIDEILTSLSFWESPAPEQHWMTMPETGILIANRFGVIFHLLTIGGCMTCFPLWKGPEEFQYHRVFTISHVNNNHYVVVQLEGEFPMPPISALWTRNKIPSAAGWQTIYMSRL